MITKKTFLSIIVFSSLLFIPLIILVYFNQERIVLFLDNVGMNFYLGMSSISAALTGFALIAVPLISNIITYDNPVSEAIRENKRLLRDIYGTLWFTSLVFLVNLLVAIIILITINVTNIIFFYIYIVLISIGVMSFLLSILGIWRLNTYILIVPQPRKRTS